MNLAAQSLRLLAAVLLVVVADLVLLTPLQHSMQQSALRDELRNGLASGALPRGPFTEVAGSTSPTLPGAPLALLKVASLGIDEVIVEGSNARQTAEGVGHKRDTVLPGQPGTSVLVGRAAAYGGPLGRIVELTPGATLQTVTSQGTFTYRVAGIRHTGDAVPAAPAPGKGRLTLVTAAGSAYAPTDLVRVDTDLVSKAAAPLGTVTPGSVPVDELPMAGVSGSTMVLLVFLVQLLLVAVVGVAWAWNRWGRRQAWIVGVPVLLALGVLSANQISFLFPNVM